MLVFLYEEVNIIMNIHGIGTDIIEIERVQNAIEKNSKFMHRVFTDRELEYYSYKKNYESIAGGFASKEAVSKAIGTGFRGFNFSDIEVLRDNLGKPLVILSKKAEEVLKNTFRNRQKDYKIHLSISHNKSTAIAYAIVEVF